MSLQPRPGAEIPPLTMRVARASNPRGTTAMWIRDRLDGLWNDEDFTAWYPRDGRPGLSPAQLAVVCVLQYAMNLSDRQAAEAVRCRIDFKYALGQELEDPGFHHSVLSDFRDRLAEGDRADRLLGLALTRIRRAGLLKGRGKQRTDSTYVLSAARELTRLELVTEAVRAVLENVVRDAPELLDELVTAEGPNATGGRCACAPSPATPSPGLIRWVPTPANCCSDSTPASPAAPFRRRPRYSERSWSSTSWWTGAAGSGRAPNTMASHLRGCRSSRRMRPRPASHGAATLAGRATSRM